MLEYGQADHGTVIMAEEQTKGRGQRGNSWQSNEGLNIQCSILFKAEFLKVEHQPYLNFVASLAVVKTLEKFDIQAMVKWPNDVLVDRKKISGILIESQISGQQLVHAVMGIGLNVNQEDMPAATATSMKLLKQKNCHVESVLNELIVQLQSFWGLLKMNQLPGLKRLYYQHLYGYQELVDLEDANGRFSGQILGVDQHGRLQVEVEQSLRTYSLKEVKFLLD